MKAIILFNLLSLVSGLWAQDNLPIFPESKRPVMQLSSMLNDEHSGEIEQKIIKIEETTGSQIAIIILPTTKPFEIEEYSIQLANKWKLGRKGIDDGILVVVAKEDRTIRIEVGYGLEGVIPDIIAKEIIEVYLTPNFKKYQYHVGFLEALNYIEGRILKENLLSPKEQQEIEFQKRIEANLREMKITRFYEKFIYFNIIFAVAMGIFFANKNWNVIGFILPGLYLTVLLLIGQFFISSYFSEGYYIFFPASLGYAIIYFIVNFRKLDEKYGSVSSSSTSSGYSSSRNSNKSSTSSKPYSSPRSSGSSSSSYRSRSSSIGYSGRGGSFGGGGASGKW